MNIQISFHTDGSVLCPWTESVRLEIHRATHIEFNNATQQWEVKDQEAKVRFFARFRSDCLG